MKFKDSMILKSEVIQKRLNEIIDFIDLTPLPDVHKRSLELELERCKTMYFPMKDEFGQDMSLNGINTQFQLDLLLEHFNSLIFEINLNSLKLFKENLENSNPNDAITQINLRLEQAQTIQSLADSYKVNTSKLNDIWLIDLLKELKTFYQSKEQSKQIKQTKQLKEKPKGFTLDEIKEKQLPKLHSLLIEHKLIDAKTLLEGFRAVLIGEPIKAMPQIKWINETRLLAYFLSVYFNGQIFTSIAGNNKMFLTKKNRISTASSLGMSLIGQNNKPPKNQYLIDNILEQLLSK